MLARLQAHVNYMSDREVVLTKQLAIPTFCTNSKARHRILSYKRFIYQAAIQCSISWQACVQLSLPWPACLPPHQALVLRHRPHPWRWSPCPHPCPWDMQAAQLTWAHPCSRTSMGHPQKQQAALHQSEVLFLKKHKVNM